jgi:hypothetical protein
MAKDGGKFTEYQTQRFKDEHLEEVIESCPSGTR